MTRQKSYLFILAVTWLSIAVWVAAHYLADERSAAPIARLSGKFHQVAHKGTGKAIIYQFPGGKRVLSLTGFRTSDSADLQVYLVAAADAFNNESVEQAGFISLGALQSAEGNQSYDVPADIDLSKYRAITIWSTKYRVNFTTAPLIQP